LKRQGFCFRSVRGGAESGSFKISGPKPVLFTVYLIMINQLQRLPTAALATELATRRKGQKICERKYSCALPLETSKSTHFSARQTVLGHVCLHVRA
jgi:hypothetical protein